MNLHSSQWKHKAKGSSCLHIIKSRCVFMICVSVRWCASTCMYNMGFFLTVCYSAICMHWRIHWGSLVVYWAQNQQNATGMRISADLPWQQRNARADGSSRIKAQHSSQRGRRTEYLIRHPHLLSWSPRPHPFSSFISVCAVICYSVKPAQMPAGSCSTNPIISKKADFYFCMFV